MLDVARDDLELSPRAKQDKCKAAVPVAQETAYLAPTYSANSFSNLFIFGPCVIKSDFKTLTTFLISLLSIFCLP